MIRYLLDPRLFNYVLMGLYGLAAVRWALEGRWTDTLYWVSALGLTLAVTLGLGR